MALIVQKYGGTSVGSIERIETVARKVSAIRDRGDNVVVVVSAMSGETNRLIALSKEIDERPDPREMDVLVSTGEQVTIALLSMALHKIGCPARSYTGGQVHILTDSAHSKARIQDIDDARVRSDAPGRWDRIQYRWESWRKFSMFLKSRRRGTIQGTVSTWVFH